MNETLTTMTPMPRLHLFELIDQDWYPRALRDLGTDYLETITNRMGIFDGAVDVLARAVRASENQQVIDLGSGGGGPLPRLLEQLASKHGLKPHVLLTDLYPNVQAAERARALGVDYLERPVDALRVPEELRGTRTFFSALHHFRPEQVRAMLADAQAKGVPIAAFDVVERTPRGLLSVLFIPLLLLLFTPLIRPLTPLRLLLTYVLPVAPLTSTWDGLVSVLRAHRPEELRAVTASLAREGYTWEVGQVPMGAKGTVTYVLGLPTARANG